MHRTHHEHPSRSCHLQMLSLLLCLSAAALVACVEATPLPTEPFESDVELETHVEDWRDEVIYQVLVDRFEDGDTNNNFNVDKRAPARYHGGDWQGLIDRLDYLQALGVTTVWISPVVRNVEEDAGFGSYHGYWTQHFLKHNPHFGSLTDLRRLSDALHDRGMKLILDIVTNHVGQVFFYDINGNGRPDEFLSGSTSMDDGPTLGVIERTTEFDPDYDPRGVQGRTSLGESGLAPIIFFHQPEITRLAPEPREIDLDGNGRIEGRAESLGFANPNWYNRRGRVTEWDSNPPDGYVQGEQTLWGDFPGGLKDLKTLNPDVQQAMIHVFSYWIDVTDADGFRIDTLKHVEYDFWRRWAPAIRQHAAGRGKRNFFMFGEVFDGRDDLLGSYTGPDMVDSVFYFSQKFRVFDNVFKCPPGNEAPYCWDGTSFRSAGTSEVQALLDDRYAFYNDTPQPNGAVDSEGNGLAPTQLLVNFIDNHDVARYLFDRNDPLGVESLHTALFYLMTTDGIPCLYYGTEQAFFGGNDPANREDMDDPSASMYTQRDLGYRSYRPFDTNSPTFQHIAELTDLRRELAPLRRGDLTLTWTSDRADDERDAGILAFERSHQGETVLVVINTHAQRASRTRAPDADGGEAMSVSFASGTVLTDVANGGETFTVAADGTVNIEVPPSSGRVLVAQ